MTQRPATPELLYGTTDPYEHPILLPAWARRMPILADAIDEGHAKRRAAGLPVNGRIPTGREED